MTATFTILNLFIAVMVAAMQSQGSAAQAEQQDGQERLADEKERVLHRNIEGLSREIAALKAMLRAGDADSPWRIPP